MVLEIRIFITQLGIEPGPQQWKNQVPTTEPSGIPKFLDLNAGYIFCALFLHMLYIQQCNFFFIYIFLKKNTPIHIPALDSTEEVSLALVKVELAQLFFFFFFSFILISWRLITLQYCSGFCHIDMNQPWIYMCSPSRSPLPPPSLSHPSGSSQCTSPKHLSHASNLDWQSVSQLIIYMFWCYSLRSSHPRLLP